MKQITIFLLEDHQLVRDGIKSVLKLNPKFNVIGESSDPQNFLTMLAGLHFDLLLTDLTMPKMSGFDVIEMSLKIKPDLKIIVLSMHDSPEYVIRAQKAGAHGYISKAADANMMIETINQVMLGKNVFNLNNEYTSPTKETGLLLSLREKEILKLISSGKSSKEIAHTLKISPRTVETHRFNTMKKLNTANMTETIALAIQLNLLN